MYKDTVTFVKKHYLSEIAKEKIRSSSFRLSRKVFIQNADKTIKRGVAHLFSVT